MADLGAFFEGRARAWADDRAFWERFAAFRIERTCGVENASGEKCLVSPGHAGLHVLAPAEGETSLRYFDSTGEPRILSRGARRWRDGAGLTSIPRNEGPRESDVVLGVKCLCNEGVQACPIHPGRLRSMVERIRFRIAFDERVARGKARHG